MKKRIFISLIVSGGFLFTAGNLESLAQSHSGGSAISTDKPVSTNTDKSGRKLAIANISKNSNTEKASKSVATLKKAVEDFGKNVSKDYLPKVNSKEITIKVPEVDLPPNLQDLCDDCITSSQQMSKFVREHALEFGAMLAKYLKQITDPAASRVTPVSQPYSAHSDGRIVPNDFGIRSSSKYFTPEGRLKTVVQR